MATIIYTHTDEAPLLATYSFLPIIQAYAAKAGVEVETRDISLAGRIIALFPERLTEEQRIDDALAELGELAKRPEANIIKLPNVSASVPQLKAAIKELQEQGYALPDYPENPQSEEDKDVRARYDKVKGSAVNPVLRQGNSDRRAPASVKNYAKAYPHRMGAWSSDSKTNVATMGEHDFKSNEKSVILPADDTLRIELETADGTTTVLKESLPVLAGEVVDATVLEVAHLHGFLRNAIARAKSEGVLFSVHLKATMMKVSDPIIFGHVVKAYFEPVFAKYGDDLAAAGLSANDGLAGILAGLDKLSNGAEIKAAFEQALADGPALAMVDSDRGITNLHVPSDVIVDASMPAMIRTSGHMWGADGQEHDTLAVIPTPPTPVSTRPSSTTAGARRLRPGHDGLGAQRRPDGPGGRGVRLPRQDLRDPGRRHRARRRQLGHDPDRARRRGRRHLARLPDQGRPDPRLGQARRDPRPRHRRPGGVLARREPRPRREPDREGQRLPARARHRGPGHQDPDARARDGVLPRADPPRRGHHLGHRQRAARLQHRPVPDPRARHLGQDALGRAADGRRWLFETGAGGSAPKHVQQLVKENYLRWDSLGEFFALAASFEHLAGYAGNARAQVLADTLDRATGTFLDRDKSPTRKLGGIDNRGSHFYLALYWAQELAEQTEDAELAAAFKPLAQTLADNEQKIVDELLAVQGSPADIGGYYRPDDAKADAVMRPSATLNEALATLG